MASTADGIGQTCLDVVLFTRTVLTEYDIEQCCKAQVEFANDAEEISALGVLQAKSDIRDSRSEVGFNIRNARLHSEDDYHVALTTLAKQG